MAAASPRILIVEDEEEVTASLKTYLESRGLTVSTAATGEKGLELLKTEKPDLVLLDMRLKEGITGMEVLRRAKLAKSLAKFIVLTAVTDRNVADLALGLGAAAYLTKPFSLEALTRLLSPHLTS